MNASTPSPSLDDVRDAFNEGDLAHARHLYIRVEPDDLSDEARAEYERLSGLLRPDPAAIAVTVILGLGLLAIAVALFH